MVAAAIPFSARMDRAACSRSSRRSTGTLVTRPRCRSVAIAPVGSFLIDGYGPPLGRRVVVCVQDQRPRSLGPGAPDDAPVGPAVVVHDDAKPLGVGPVERFDHFALLRMAATGLPRLL